MQPEKALSTGEEHGTLPDAAEGSAFVMPVLAFIEPKSTHGGNEHMSGNGKRSARSLKMRMLRFLKKFHRAWDSSAREEHPPR